MNGAPSLAAKVAVGGAPAAVVTVWAITTWGHAVLTPLEASAIGALGASVLGYIWHVTQALVTVLLQKAGADPIEVKK